MHFLYSYLTNTGCVVWTVSIHFPYSHLTNTGHVVWTVPIHFLYSYLTNTGHVVWTVLIHFTYNCLTNTGHIVWTVSIHFPYSYLTNTGHIVWTVSMHSTCRSATCKAQAMLHELFQCTFLLHTKYKSSYLNYFSELFSQLQAILYELFPWPVPVATYKVRCDMGTVSVNWLHGYRSSRV